MTSNGGACTVSLITTDDVTATITTVTTFAWLHVRDKTRVQVKANNTLSIVKRSENAQSNLYQRCSLLLFPGAAYLPIHCTGFFSMHKYYFLCTIPLNYTWYAIFHAAYC